MKEQMSKWICEALIWKKGQTYSRSSQGECNTRVLDGNSNADSGLTLKKKLLKIEGMRKWIELLWEEESNSLGPELFK